MKLVHRLSSAFLAFGLLLGVSRVSAHVRLIDPPPRLDGREGNQQLKNGPCGQMSNARTTTVTEFSPGETITLTFGEYINHTSYYRVALDVDGDDDFPMRPNQSVAPGGDDPTAINPVSDINDTSLPVYILGYYLDDMSPPPMQEQEYSMEVTLPNIECENCTLQLIQFMYNDDMPYYFQCADIAIRGTVADSTTSTTTTTSTGAGGTMGTASTDGTVSSVTTGTTGAGGAGMTSTTGADNTITSTSATATVSTTTGTTGGTVAGATVTSTSTSTVTTGATQGTATTGGLDTTDGGTPPTAQPAADESGCACRAASAGPNGFWLAALLTLGVFGYRRRAKLTS